jgi:hypothetical protein
MEKKISQNNIFSKLFVNFFSKIFGNFYLSAGDPYYKIVTFYDFLNEI